MKENLVFKCDRAYEGDGNLSRIIEKNCKVEAIYFIQSTADASYALEFVLPSDRIVTTSVNDAPIETTLPNLLNVSDLEKKDTAFLIYANFVKERLIKSIPLASRRNL